MCSSDLNTFVNERPRTAMSETTMDAAAKGRVKDALVASARAQLQASEGQVSSEEAAATVDQDSPYAVDDLSQSDEAGDMSALFEGAAARQKANVDAIQALDDEVEALEDMLFGDDVRPRAFHQRVFGVRKVLAQLRRKLEVDPSHPKHLLTEAGMGYRFQE